MNNEQTIVLQNIEVRNGTYTITKEPNHRGTTYTLYKARIDALGNKYFTEVIAFTVTERGKCDDGEEYVVFSSLINRESERERESEKQNQKLAEDFYKEYSPKD